MTTPQLALALQVVAQSAGGTTDNGADELNKTREADSLLGTIAGSSYGQGIYFMCFLNLPTATGQWMLQFGGHHVAYNIAFNGGNVVGGPPGNISWF